MYILTDSVLVDIKEYVPIFNLKFSFYNESMGVSCIETEILQAIIEGQAPDETLNSLCHLVESCQTTTVCSIMQLDEVTGLLHVTHAPNVPISLQEELNGLQPGCQAGSCGTSVYLRRPVFVVDTSADSRWETMRDFADRSGIKSCWSVPIWASTEKVVGSFAISHLSPAAPTPENERIILMASRLAGLVIHLDRERKRQEAAQTRILQSQKLESMGLLAGGIAHDFNNLLFSIMANADMLSELFQRGSEEFQMVNDIQVGSEKLRDICRTLTQYAGGAKDDKRTIDINRLARELATLLDLTAKPKAELHYELDAEEVFVDGAPGQVSQVMLNLMTNACDAIQHDQGRITLSTGQEVLSRSELDKRVLGSHCATGSFSYIQVRDNGCGMSRETQSRMFDPFYTTKGPGRGLGMAGLLGIIREHRGCISVHSEVGQGTTIRLSLPRTCLADPGNLAPITTSQSFGTVLIVDDEEMVRRTTERLLRNLGFAVVAAHNGPEAVSLVEAGIPELGFALVDQSMPGWSGQETVERLRTLRPSLAIAMVSGTASPPDEETGLFFLSKPYSRQQLSALMTQMAESPVPSA